MGGMVEAPVAGCAVDHHCHHAHVVQAVISLAAPSDPAMTRRRRLLSRSELGCTFRVSQVL